MKVGVWNMKRVILLGVLGVMLVMASVAAAAEMPEFSVQVQKVSRREAGLEIVLSAIFDSEQAAKSFEFSLMPTTYVDGIPEVWTGDEARRYMTAAEITEWYDSYTFSPYLVLVAMKTLTGEDFLDDGFEYTFGSFEVTQGTDGSWRRTVSFTSDTYVTQERKVILEFTVYDVQGGKGFVDRVDFTVDVPLK